ncbi:MAG: flagellar basal-body MS-ring/collar protein FliF [Bdellovibrionales bacterium]
MRNLGPGRLAAMGAVLIGLIAFFVFIGGRMATPGMSLLYSGLSSADASAIVQQLDAQKIPYELSTDGSTISVPSNQVARMRMDLAGEGLPRGGSIGYEIFDQPEGFGTTSFVQSINHLRALEGELARTVGTLSNVQQARVHLVLPKRELFGRSEQKATASVFLRLKSGGLSKEQIGAIQNLVAAAVPQLDPQQISIVDDRGNLLARANGNQANANIGQNQDDLRIAFESEQQQKIEDLLAKTLGYGRVRAQVSADINFDRIITNSEIYDPDGQVVRSTQTTTEESTEGTAGDGGTVSITNNLPGGEAAAAGGGAGGSNTSRSEETVNFEISKTIKEHIQQSGEVKRMSIAVLVDGNYAKAEDGTETYTPRTDEELEKIKSLVRSAVNFNEKRGDTLEVQNMRFAEVEMGDGGDTGEIMGLAKADVMRLAEMLIMGILAILVILLVVRPLMRRAMEGFGPAGGEGQAAIAGGGQGAIAGGGRAALAPPSGMAMEADEAEAQLIDISRIEGRVRASAVKKVGEIIDKHPDESVSILRNWIYQQGR